MPRTKSKSNSKSSARRGRRSTPSKPALKAGANRSKGGTAKPRSEPGPHSAPRSEPGPHGTTQSEPGPHSKPAVKAPNAGKGTPPKGTPGSEMGPHQ